MIRINLLGVPKTKKAKRQAISIGAGANTMVIGLIVAALFAGGNYYYYFKLNSESQQLQKDLDAAKRENGRLAGVKAKYQEREKQFQLYDRRVKVIHQLQSAQTGPSELLNTIASTVNSTDAVWLDSMTEDGANINLSGTAISANAVANLISNLKKSNYFKTVEIKETFQDERVKDIQAFTFKVICEKQKS
jgi:type IV pilus assembly protein PilN